MSSRVCVSATERAHLCSYFFVSVVTKCAGYSRKRGYALFVQVGRAWYAEVSTDRGVGEGSLAHLLQWQTKRVCHIGIRYLFREWIWMNGKVPV